MRFRRWPEKVIEKDKCAATLHMLIHEIDHHHCRCGEVIRLGKVERGECCFCDEEEDERAELEGKD